MDYNKLIRPFFIFQTLYCPALAFCNEFINRRVTTRKKSFKYFDSVSIDHEID